jgi:hypothetical protein
MPAADPNKWFYVTSQVYKNDLVMGAGTNTVSGSGGVR